MSATINKANFQKIYSEAYAAGQAAAAACNPTPMTVVGGGKSYFVPDGVCGFAWVKVRPGNSPFANWLKKNNLARSAYNGGVDIWISDYGQSCDRKTAHAYAMAKVLREAGIKAYADSRLD